MLKYLLLIMVAGCKGSSLMPCPYQQPQFPNVGSTVLQSVAITQCEEWIRNQ